MPALASKTFVVRTTPLMVANFPVPPVMTPDPVAIFFLVPSAATGALRHRRLADEELVAILHQVFDVIGIEPVRVDVVGQAA